MSSKSGDSAAPRNLSAFDALMSGDSAAPPTPSRIESCFQHHPLPPLANLKRKSPYDSAAPPNPSPIESSKSHSWRSMLAELKSRIPALKNSAAEFDPKDLNLVLVGEGDRVPFIFLCLAFDLISKEEDPIVITHVVRNVLRTVVAAAPHDLLASVYLFANRIAPRHEWLELDIPNEYIIRALGELNIGCYYTVFRRLAIADTAIRSSAANPLTVANVFDTFRLIAKESGHNQNSQEKLKSHIKGLFAAATDCEPQYLIHLLQGRLRFVLYQQTLLEALGQAAVYAENYSKPPSHIQSPLEEAGKIVKQVYSVLPDYDKIVAALLSDGVWNLPKTCPFTLGVPIGPMLAKPVKDIEQIRAKFRGTRFTCEYNYDGARAEIHYMENGTVEIYIMDQRKTDYFPEVVGAIRRSKKESISSFVLDCELVAYDQEKKKIRPFLALLTGARKNVCIYAFDMLYLNGKPLLQEELVVRSELLHNSFVTKEGYFQFATERRSTDVEEILMFLRDAVKAGCEGLIVKTLDRDATYEPSKGPLNWLELNKNYLYNICIRDSIDLVPIAAFHGQGNRTGLYGAFLLACYDDDSEEFQSICKIGTDFPDDVLKERTASLRSKVIPAPKSCFRYSDTLRPDVWFEPSEVWEVKATELTTSPVYCAAVDFVDSHKKTGISLRSPHLLCICEDKAPTEATSAEQIAELYDAQEDVKKGIPRVEG